MQSKSEKIGSFKWNKGVTLKFEALSNLKSLGILSIDRYLCRKMIHSINYMKFWSCFENTGKCTFEESDEGYILKCFITNDTGYDIDYIDFVLTQTTKSQEYKMSSKIYDWRKNEKKNCHLI